MSYNLFLALFWGATAFGLPSKSPSSSVPSCRYALEYSQKDILKDPRSFISDYLYWEGKFHQNNVSYNTENGCSYDGTQIDWSTGEATLKHSFSAASKESLQIMLYAQAISGSQGAARFLSPEKPSAAADIAVSVLEKKLTAYLNFNETYPGFGGFLPWFMSDQQTLSPTWDWVNRVPALDNGELLWAVYGMIQALENSSDQSYRKLAQGWSKWLDYTKSTAAKMFYTGNGNVCTVMDIANQSWPVNDPRQRYTCESTSMLDDPYEGELFTWWLYFYSPLSAQDKEMLWEVKRPKLVSVEYNMGGVGPITVQQGYWFSSHEQWKALEMPYYDVDLVRRLFTNAERARTCNSVVTRNPGMFASVNNITNTTTDEIVGYISPAGIPSISSQTVQEHDVITPYSVFPTLLVDQSVGLAWLRNMLIGKKMQNPYGSTEATRVDGTGVSALLTWDSKVTTVNALLGGVQDLVRQGLRKEGLYNLFISITQREYSRVFKNLKGENIDLCLPEESIPDAGLVDFTLC
ncbi:putative GPI anchored protein [Coniochaeta ligniaria NRRL 30616]|uniref:Putative GPI anchored protein n=1 Tax=Coniochaeta ligniaria NRRL 30616 TaxID=1408157 RepID=A0A1J7J4L9_9PEZI|nr:putative GPI anchored protein [Coniochaeta ligniaria NRRL 30616]